MNVLVGLTILLSVMACDPAPDGLPRPTSPTRVSDSPLALSKENVPREPFHLNGLSARARFIRNTSTGTFKVRPRVNVGPGSRVDLAGHGCTDADSVHVVLFRREPLERGAHERDQTWISTKIFPTSSEGWSGTMQLPRRPAVAEYGLWAACEVGGHAYFPSGRSVFVGR